jgi:hypothetical protein
VRAVARGVVAAQRRGGSTEGVIMPHRTFLSVRASLVAALVVSASLSPALLQAQQPLPDFLFRTPPATLGLRVGFASPRADSEVFDFTRDQLTLGSSAFDGVTFGAQLGIRVTDRLEIAIDGALSSSETRTEFRDWVDVDDRPIEQTTMLNRLPLTVSVKGYLRDRGRSISRFAWIPAAWTPYVGAGAGVMWYAFEQDGDWVDFETLDIFYDNFRSAGSTPTMHLLGGLDVSLSPRFLLNTEGRYLWASAPMDGRDFVGFDDIDLSGFQLTAGLSVRF